MSTSMHHPDAKQTVPGVKNMSLSFMTNGSSSPLAASFRGADPIQSVVRTGTGTFLLTLKPGYYYRYEIAKTGDLEAANGADGAYATIGAIAGTGTSTGNITIVINTHAVGGTLTDFGTGGTGVSRRCSVFVDWKDSAVGT